MNYIIQKKHNKSRNHSRGFTLIELIVSMGLFITVLSISTAAIYTMGETNRRVQNIRVTMDNVNLAMEDISRNLRTGRTYHCAPSGFITPANLTGTDCTPGKNSIAFVSSAGRIVVYKQENERLWKSIDGGVNFIALTSPDLVVDDLVFEVVGAATLDDEQPHVFISLTGTAGSTERAGSSTFTLQTMATQRTAK